jgi:hypothetical protein
VRPPSPSLCYVVAIVAGPPDDGQLRRVAGLRRFLRFSTPVNNEDALRARARRAARIDDGRLVADLGIVRGVKFGAHWRFVFDGELSGAFC